MIGFKPSRAASRIVRGLLGLVVVAVAACETPPTLNGEFKVVPLPGNKVKLVAQDSKPARLVPSLEELQSAMTVSEVEIRTSFVDKELLVELQSNRNLRCLSLTKCSMQSSTQELFSSFVQLKKLRLLDCGIPEETIRGIGQALNTCEVIPRVP